MNESFNRSDGGAVKKSTAKSLAKFVHDLGPIPNATCLLMHLGDENVFRPYVPGEEPKWAVVCMAMLVANPHITVAQVCHELASRKEVVAWKQ
jgi:hypothetical protein